jgi:hypothetical protein
MRTVLRKVSTGLYFKGPDQWTNDPSEAHNFKMIDRALEFIAKWKLQDIEVVFAFKERGTVTRVPLDRIETKYSPT